MKTHRITVGGKVVQFTIETGENYAELWGKRSNVGGKRLPKQFHAVDFYSHPLDEVTHYSRDGRGIHVEFVEWNPVSKTIGYHIKVQESRND